MVNLKELIKNIKDRFTNIKIPKNIIPIIENVIIILIILVLIQTFLDEISIIRNWCISARKFLIVTGFLFDLIFTIEFILRIRSAAKKRKIKMYLMFQRGWVDFLASIPLLLLNSTPTLLVTFSSISAIGVQGAGLLNVLKIAKAIRITRILRLLRTLKIFGKIKNAKSVMAQRHIANICTTAVATIIIFLIADATISSFVNYPGISNLKMKDSQLIVENIKMIEKTSPTISEKRQEIYKYLAKNDSILKIYFNNEIMLSNFAAN